MTSQNKTNRFGRRGLLGGAAAAGGGLILSSLATGIPAHILLNPLNAKAEEPTGKLLILSTSSQGDPLNANVPGCYAPEFTDLYHPQDPAMAESSLMLSGSAYTAAKPWADLPQHMLDRTMFFHHATYTPVHGELGRVQKLMGSTEKNDMLISLIARELASGLGTVQSDPVSLGANGGELLSSAGRILGNVAPTSVRQALGGVDGPLKDLQGMRDNQIDRIYKLYREHGTPSQRTMLDAWARSRDEVRNISTALVGMLDLIDGNDAPNQVRCAAVLAAMKISPCITIHLDFGRDNHSDTDLTQETAKHLISIPLFQDLRTQLDQLKADGILTHDVLIGSLNVFGRTLKKKGYNGRDHNKGHHVTMLMGEGIRGGVIGGVELNPGGKEYVAQDIDATTGAGGVGGDIPFEDTLGAVGKTMGVALGVSAERMDEIVTTGKVVAAAFA